MLFGGRAAFSPETDRTIRESAEILRRGMLAVFPQLRDADVEYAWGGSLDFTYDMLPHAGGDGGVHYAFGYAGHGVAMATYMGAQVARSIAGDAVDDPLFDLPAPRAPLRAHFATPWLLPLAGAWFKLMDWAS
jgi:glycine/D-amino acid oxidase-like deaminating enzyme